MEEIKIDEAVEKKEEKMDFTEDTEEAKGERVRLAQPKGYAKNNHSNGKVMFYHCKRHDYVYYPENWVDTDNAVRNMKGYYDENGEYYTNVLFSNNDVYEFDVTCHNCEKTSHVLWGKDGIPNCPGCGESLEEEINLIDQDDILFKEERVEKVKDPKKTVMVLAVIAAIISLLSGAFIILRGFHFI